MSANRRTVLKAGGGLIAALSLPHGAEPAEDIVEIAMEGRPDGSRVWFDPVGLHVQPGQTVRWTNRDTGNAHTTTAYHPANEGRPRRIPATAESWNSGYLLPEESFSLTFGQSGVFDYFCIPHEAAGMVGRIVVGQPGQIAGLDLYSAEGIPAAAREAFPPVSGILSRGRIRPPAAAEGGER